MWQDATPAPPAAAPALHAEHDYVLWVQLVLCALALAGVWAARSLRLPVYAQLRVAYTAAMTAVEDDLLGGERRFVHFAQQTLHTWGQAAQEVLAQLRPDADQAAEAGSTPAVPDTAAPAPAVEPFAGLPTQTVSAAVPTRLRRGKTAPAGSTLQSYCPAFALLDPLGGRGGSNTSSYGWRVEPVSGKGDNFHTGTDLAAAEGTPVLAAAAGVVRYAGHGASYGNYLRLLHADGDETLYAHLQYLFVHAGQNVSAGEVVGTVGQTGHVTGPHLHFELLHQGVRYDPAQALQAAG